MKDVAIRAAGLGKLYKLKRQAGGYRTLREELMGIPRLLWSKIARSDSRGEEFWALKNIGFELSCGEVLGVIGRNGAGKSTLLKILSRIVEPSCGEAEVFGRVGSLLEVGTGFHPELTGRENIFLSGAILGMKRSEIRRNFDEIVSFAEVGRFVDTPCKYYSSGMYMRLAFSVAAHLDPEILIVDEVLAVGDAAFQQRCLGKVRALSREQGRTVIFVSHNIAAVRNLCTRGLYLKAGQLVELGEVDKIVGLYSAEQNSEKSEYRRSSLESSKDCWIESARVTGTKSAEQGSFAFGRPIEVEIAVTARVEIPTVQVALRVSTAEGAPVLTTSNFDESRKWGGLSRGSHRFKVNLPPIFAPGFYDVLIALCDPQKEVFDVVESEVTFSIDAIGSLGVSLGDGRRGSIEMALPWDHST